ncbi:MAG: M1 family metallopeptidase [Gammaproteobacteria bacterium]|nr:M1 family metallopeptidase [Gammaproteobacteria bacterium]
MNGRLVWCLTLHEMRKHRKLLRTHIFIWIALLVSAVYFLMVTLNHMYGASVIPMLGVISPRYIMSLLGSSFIGLFCIGALLLTFDQIKRDETDQIHEVVSSKPPNNLELLLGRLFGATMTMVIPMLLFLFAALIYGVISDLFSIPFGEPIEIWSVVSLIFLDIVPNFLFFGSLLILLSSLLKFRLLALLLTLCSLFLLFWLNGRISLSVSSPIQTVSGNVLFPSELIPTLFTPITLFNRIALLFLSFGFLYWSSSVGSRITRSSSKELMWGSLSFVLGVLLVVTMFGIQTIRHKEVETWVRVHNEEFAPSAFPDIHQIRGRVDIYPGRSLSLDLALDVSLDADSTDDYILLSLNPGYQISRLSVAGEKVNNHDFQHGLLKIPRQFFNSDVTTVELSAKGHPDRRFAYLDSVDTLAKISGPDVRQLRQLGTQNSIFHPDFVALVPGIKWYPTSGTATNEDAWEVRERDFFTLDIEVSVPRNWLVAGPAKRESLEDKPRTTFSFQQSSPLPEFALVGSRFESGSIEVEGIVFEVLYSKAHRKTFERFAQIADRIRESTQYTVERFRTRGFVYPYGSYSFVEVPSTLRVFGGGVTMDTVMCPPGMVMIRESTLPTIPIESLLEGRRREWLDQPDFTELDWIAWQFGSIRTYLTQPMFESNIDFGFFQSLLGQQIGVTGDGARTLRMFIDTLLESFFPSVDASFDFYIAMDRELLNLASINPLDILVTTLNGDLTNLPERMHKVKQKFYESPDVQSLVESASVYDPIQGENRILKLRAMQTRIEQVAKYLFDVKGTDTMAPIAIDMSNEFRGKSVDFKDFLDVLNEQGIGSADLGGDLFKSAGLPGFIAADPSSKELETDDRPKYLTSILIQNGEPVSGPVRLALKYQNSWGFFHGQSLTPILVGANQSLYVEIESLNPVQQVWVQPYLSLNRMNIRADLPTSAELQELEFIRDELPSITLIEERENLEQGDASITIDDLDPGFSIVDHRRKSELDNAFVQFFQRLFSPSEIQMDHGLPAYQLLGSHWQREEWLRTTDPTAFGRYRRTFVLSKGGEGLAFAKFSTKLPSFGEWQLEYFLPEGFFYEERQYRGSRSISSTSIQKGTVNLEIKNGSTSLSRSLDVSNLESGWHVIGDFELIEAEVDVLISDKTDNTYVNVLADAIRWTPIEKEDEE